MPLINFHTHLTSQKEGEVRIVSLNVEEVDNIESLSMVTVGVHPWQTDSNNMEDLLAKFHELIRHPNVIGIGEVGLDRLRGGSLTLQAKYLREQAIAAASISKPVVIHCVRAWSELVETLSAPDLKQLTKAIHGFRGKADLARQLVDRNYYLSFGSILVDPSPELAESLTVIPKNRLFFETDTSEMPIGEIYSAAADILDTSVDELTLQIENNLNTFFGFNG